MKEDIKVQVCRLCLGLIPDKSFSSIKDSIKDMLQVITTDLDLDVSDLPVMCLECLKSLQEMFNFKTNFFEADEKIDSKIANVKHNKLNLKDIMNNAFKKRRKWKSEDYELCRTCLETIEGNTFISLNKNADICLTSMLDSCLPELDLDVTSDPVMCQTCYKIVQKIRNFKAMCEINGSQIDVYKRRIICSSFPKKVNLYSVLQFLSGIPRGIEVKIEPPKSNGEVKSEENVDLSKEHDELKVHPEYVMVKIEPNNEDISQQVKIEPKEEFCEGENRLEYVNIKMDSTDDDGGIGQCPVNTGKSNADAKNSALNTTKRNHVKVKSKNKLSNRRLRSRRLSNKLTPNTASKESKQNSIMRCSGCDYKTKHKSNLQRHQTLFPVRDDVVAHKKFSCDKCDFVTKFNIDLITHNMLSHIIPDKTLQCSRCEFSTYKNSELMNHVISSHVTPETVNKDSILKAIAR